MKGFAMRIMEMHAGIMIARTKVESILSLFHHLHHLRLFVVNLTRIFHQFYAPTICRHILIIVISTTTARVITVTIEPSHEMDGNAKGTMSREID